MIRWGLFSVSPAVVGRLGKAKQQGYCSKTTSLNVHPPCFFSSCREGLQILGKMDDFCTSFKSMFLSFWWYYLLLAWFLGEYILCETEDFNPTLSGIIVISMVHHCSVNSLLTLKLNYFCSGLLFAEKSLDTWECGQHKLSSLGRQVNLCKSLLTVTGQLNPLPYIIWLCAETT